MVYVQKEIETRIVTSTVLVASELDEPSQAIANAAELWPKGLLSGCVEISSIENTYLEYVSPEDKIEEIDFPEQLKGRLPIQRGSIYRVLMIKKFLREKGTERWMLNSVDFSNAEKVGE